MCALLLYFITLQSLDPLLDSDGYLTLLNALNAHKLRESALMGLKWQKIQFKGKYDLSRKQSNGFFIYYFFYILLNFAFIYVLKSQLKFFGMIPFLNNDMIYVALAVGLFFELMLEINNLKKLNTIMTVQ